MSPVHFWSLHLQCKGPELSNPLAGTPLHKCNCGVFVLLLFWGTCVLHAAGLGVTRLGGVIIFSGASSELPVPGSRLSSISTLGKPLTLIADKSST